MSLRSSRRPGAASQGVEGIRGAHTGSRRHFIEWFDYAKSAEGRGAVWTVQSGDNAEGVGEAILPSWYFTECQAGH
jgi:hypothetical protein